MHLEYFLQLEVDFQKLEVIDALLHTRKKN